MTGYATTARAIALAAMIAFAAGQSGCASDSVEFNGKIFEAVGLAGGGAFGKRQEPRTEARAPLVMPPDTQRLPEPGSAPEPAVVADGAWPRDPQRTAAAEAEARRRAHEEFCRNGNWKEKAHGKEIEAAQGPEGSCNGSLFSVLGKQLFGQ